MARTKSQLYSDHVFRTIEAYLHTGAQGGTNAKKYKGLCKRSGGMLRTMGLMHYLAFLQARGSRPSEQHNHDLCEHLLDACRAFHLVQAQGNRDILESVRALPVPAYMRLTREILSLLQWHKQLADVMIAGADEESDFEEN